MTIQRRSILGAAAASVFATPILNAAAQGTPAWPTRPIRLIVPNAPGGATDILARTMQVELQKLWQPQLIVEYKPGANTVLGTDFVAKSPPDGHTLGMVVTSHLINPSLRKGLPYDTLKDLAHVSMTAVSGLLLSASAKAPFNNLKEMIAYAKANPGRLSYATPGAGSSMHLAGELLKQQAGIFMLHVPYKGTGGGAYTDVGDGRVELIIDATFASTPHIRGGRLKPLAVLSARRDESLPQIPAAAEVLTGFDVQSVNGIVVPAATPREIVQKISADFAQVLRSDSLRARLREMGLESIGSTPQQFENFVRSELKRWDAVVKKAHITLD